MLLNLTGVPHLDFMDPRLEEAAHSGDVSALQELLEQNKLLLHQPSTVSYPTNNPLHIAASLGHAEFAREILTQNPRLARRVNGQGLSPLHLASGNGHLAVVKELLSKVGSDDLCLLRDKNGLLPIHTAAINNEVHVVEELMNATSVSIHTRTCLGDTILHLAVKFNCFEAIKFLIERLDQDGDYEFLMSKDAKGNTILHLATARKQLEIVKLLLSKPWANVNAVNSKGSTVLDVLLESPCERGDLILGEMIRAAGGKTSAEGDEMREPRPNDTLNISVERSPPARTNTAWRRILKLFLKYPLASVGLGYLVGAKEHDYVDYYRNAPGTLMVVAALIATVAFQGGLNPPGGFLQKQDLKGLKGDHYAGEAVNAEQLKPFVWYDMIAMLTSLSVILLLICLPRRKGLVRVMMWMTWIAVFFMGLAFDVGIFSVFPNTSPYFYSVWFYIVSAFAVWLCIRFSVYALKRARCLNDKKPAEVQAQAHIGDPRAVSPFTRRFIASVAIFTAIAATAGLIYILVSPSTFSYKVGFKKIY